MGTSPLPSPVLVADDHGLERLVGALAACPIVAVDTESNSLHAYRERVCLIQLSIPGADHIVDPIRLPNLGALGPLFANPNQQKIFHAAEGDLVGLRRDHGFDFQNIFDTMSAARSLGWPQVGLAAILDTHFGVKLNKKYQRADWGRRPLTVEQLDYARLDTHYLPELRDRQLQALTEAGLWPEAEEEFARLARPRADSDRAEPDPTMAFWRVSGARGLTSAQAAVLQALFAYREEQAARLDVPVFKVMGAATLIELCRRAPSRAEDMQGVPGMPPQQIRRHAEGVLRAVHEGLRAPAPRAPEADVEPDDVRDRYDRLHAWRKGRAQARGVESDVILPRTALRDLARRGRVGQESGRRIPATGGARPDDVGRTPRERPDARDHLAVEGQLDVRLAGDRVALSASGGWWMPLAGGNRFRTGGLLAAWRSSENVSLPVLSAVAETRVASRGAPLALWHGAGTGDGRSGLLRAHPLLISDVLTGPVFGRRVTHGSVEYARPLLQTLGGGLSIAGFVDAARAWQRPNSLGASPLYVDAGVGLRVRAPGGAGTIRLDVARGLRGGGTTLSAGWGRAWPH